MKKILLLFVCLLVTGISALWAQPRQVNGVVTEKSTGQPAFGVTVNIKGTTTAVATDDNGHYTINVPDNGVLVFSAMNMRTQEIAVGTRSVINVVMEEDAQVLEEVIMVAYGTANPRALTSSAKAVKGEALAKQQSSNVTKTLEGRVAGLQTFSSSGQPGSAASINIRGIGSISAAQNPLIILDGVPYEGSLNTINNHDVESMTVLKDAAASSLYGARGSNGVILISTKKGKDGKPTIQFENRTGVNSRAVQPYDVVESPQEYYELFWEAIRNRRMYAEGISAAGAGVYASEQLVPVLGNYNIYNVANNQLVDPFTGKLNPGASLIYEPESWFDEAFRFGLRQENNLSLRGGNDKTKYYASVNYLYDNSYTVNSDFQRISGRLSLDQEVKSWLKMGVNLAMSTTSTNSPNVGGTTLSSIFFAGQMIAPIYPVYQHDKQSGDIMYNPYTGLVLYDYGVEEGVDGGHARPYAANSNAIAQQERDIRKATSDVISARTYAAITFLKDFKFTANISMDAFNSTSVNFQTPDGGDAANVGGRSTKEMQRYYVINANQLLNWSRTFNDDHHVEALLGHETKADNVSSLAAQREKFFIIDNPELNNAASLIDASSSSAGYALEGFFGEAKYDYKSKYYFTTSYRRDASSRFHPDSRWGDFWSVSGAWRLTEESFMSDTKDWLTDFKLKASYGTQGNDNVGNNQPYKDQYVVTNQDGEIGINYVFRGNKDVTWEKSKSFNAGLEARLFDKLNVTFEYFIKNTDDMIYYKPLPPSAGLPGSRIENSMGMKNTGIELELSWDIIKTADFNWTADFNVTHYVNELTKLPPDRPQDGWNAGGGFYRKLGSSAYNYINYKWAGVDPTNGAPQYYKDVLDQDGNVTGTTIVNSTGEATLYDLEKSAIPDVYGGLATTVSYKGIDLSIETAYQIGGWVYDSPYASLMSGGSAGQTFHTDIYDRWTPNNTGSSIPRLESSNLDIFNGDRSLTKGTHLSIKNITLGYNFPKSIVSKIGVEQLRVYAVADNLWLFSARKGFDPRQSLSGGTGYAYAAVRTVSFGLNINF